MAGKKKNLLLKKELYASVLDGITYQLPKGTVLHNHGTKGWSILGKTDSGENMYVDKRDVNANPDWFDLTTKKGTYEMTTIGNNVVKFHKNHINVGCQKVTKKQIVEILAKMEEA